MQRHRCVVGAVLGRGAESPVWANALHMWAAPTHGHAFAQGAGSQQRLASHCVHMQHVSALCVLYVCSCSTCCSCMFPPGCMCARANIGGPADLQAPQSGGVLPHAHVCSHTRRHARADTHKLSARGALWACRSPLSRPTLPPSAPPACSPRALTGTGCLNPPVDGWCGPSWSPTVRAHVWFATHSVQRGLLDIVQSLCMCI